jgi:sulfonate transport system permease protein
MATTEPLALPADLPSPVVLTAPALAPAPAPPAVAAAGAPAAPDLVDARRAGRPHRLDRVPRWLRRLAGPLLVVAAWQALTAVGIIGPRTLAPPSEVLAAGWELLRTGELITHLLTSLRRVAVGLSLGVLTGAALAVVAGLFRLGEDVVDSSVQVLRAIPTLGLLGLVIMWFGIDEGSKVFLVAFGTTFPIYLNTYAAIRGVDERLVEAGTTFGLSRGGLVRKVIFPGAVPGFLVGLRFALVGSWLIMIVAEQINSRSGLGYLINEARSWYRTDIIVLGLAIYGLLGVGADGLVRLLERTLLSWRRGFSGT